MSRFIPSNLNEYGLLPDEQVVMDKISECYNAFLKLDRQHPTELNDFVNAIHRIQDAMALRAVRRAFPGGWKTYSNKGKNK